MINLLQIAQDAAVADGIKISHMGRLVLTALAEGKTYLDLSPMRRIAGDEMIAEEKRLAELNIKFALADEDLDMAENLWDFRNFEKARREGTKGSS